MKKEPTITTLCWACKRAANAGLSDKRTCTWAASLEPVEGWLATPEDGGSYTVLECPLFEPEPLLCKSCIRKQHAWAQYAKPCTVVPAQAGHTNLVGHCGKYIRQGEENPKEFMYADHSDTSARPVKQFTTDKVLIKVWKSLTSAAEGTGTQVGSIAKVCRKERRTAGGYYWEYEEGL